MDGTPDTPTTALVLAGGGSFCAAQVGMLRALVAHGLVPDLAARPGQMRSPSVARSAA